MARLFFALWPDAAARGGARAPSRPTLARAGRRQAGAGREDPPHARLPGRCRRRARRRRASRSAASRLARAFRCALDRVGSFRARARRLGGRRSRRRAELARAAARSPTRSRARGFALEERAVRAARHAGARRSRDRSPRAAIEPIEWRARRARAGALGCGNGTLHGDRGLATAGLSVGAREMPACEALPGRVACRLRGTGRVAPRIRVQPSGFEGEPSSAHRLDQRRDDWGDRGSHHRLHRGRRLHRGLALRRFPGWLLLLSRLLGRLLLGSLLL